MKSTALAAILVSIACFDGWAQTYTYQASCSAGSSPSPVPNATIISTFGEPRPTTGATLTDPVRFHGGADIQQCEQGALQNVFSILGGTRTIPTACKPGTNAKCVRIQDSMQPFHAFDYEHITISGMLASTGTFIPAGTLLGSIDTAQHALHLQEATGPSAALAYRVNPQRPNALNFDHAREPDGSPTFTQTSITGASDQSIILLPANSADGLQPSPTSFVLIDGTYYVSGKIAVLVAASGGDGSTDPTTGRRGVFAAGYTLTPVAKKPSSYNIAFRQILDGQTNTDDCSWGTADGYPEGPARVCHGYLKKSPLWALKMSPT